MTEREIEEFEAWAVRNYPEQWKHKTLAFDMMRDAFIAGRRSAPKQAPKRVTWASQTGGRALTFDLSRVRRKDQPK